MVASGRWRRNWIPRSRREIETHHVFTHRRRLRGASYGLYLWSAIRACHGLRARGFPARRRPCPHLHRRRPRGDHRDSSRHPRRADGAVQQLFPRRTLSRVDVRKARYAFGRAARALPVALRPRGNRRAAASTSRRGRCRDRRRHLALLPSRTRGGNETRPTAGCSSSAISSRRSPRGSRRCCKRSPPQRPQAGLAARRLRRRSRARELRGLCGLSRARRAAAIPRVPAEDRHRGDDACRRPLRPTEPLRQSSLRGRRGARLRVAGRLDDGRRHPRLVDEQNGRLVAPDDPVALADTIDDILGNLDTYDRGAIAAAARDKYSLEVVGRPTGPHLRVGARRPTMT